MVTVEKKHPVFISFATEDADVVRDHIHRPLEGAGFEVFMYTETRDGGVIAPKIQDALDRAGSLVFALSEHSADPNRDWLTSELDAFLFTHQLEAVTVVNVGTIAPLRLLEQSLMRLRGHDVLEKEGWSERAWARLKQPPERKPKQAVRPPSLPEWIAKTWPLEDKIADHLPLEFFNYPDPIVDELHSKITKAGVVILHGSQHSGKSKLLRQLADRFPDRVEVDRIRLQDIKAGLQSLFAAGRQRAAPRNKFLLPLAAWASYVARYVFDKLEREERDRVAASPGGPYLAEYADDINVALEDITNQVSKTRDGSGGPNEILAFQRSLSTLLRPVWDYANRVQPVLLPILIEDFHQYAKLSEATKGPSGYTTDLQGFAEDFLEHIDHLATAQMQSNRKPDPFYIIVTTRAVETPGRIRKVYEDLEERTKSIQPKDVASALSSGLTSWSEEDISALLAAAMQAVSGHTYLLNRFLRAATALRRTNRDRSVGEIVEAVESLPQIWYQDQLFKTGENLASPRSPDDPMPGLHPTEYTPFLASVALLAREDTQFLAQYRKILESHGRWGDTAYNKAYLIPLLQLGLIKAIPEKQDYVPSCRIVEKWFSPTRLETLFNSRS